MNQKNLLLICLAIVLMTLMTLMTFMTGLSPDDESVDEPGLLFPQLKTHLSDLSRLEISSATDSVTLIRDEAGWLVVNIENYPADFSVLSNFINALSQARLVERKTNRPENFSTLELQTDGDGQATRVTGIGKDYEFSVLIGKSSEARAGQFIRLPDSNQVWLTSNALVADTAASSWLEPVILNIDAADISEVLFVDEFGETAVHVKRLTTNEEMVLVNLPEGRSLRYPTVVDEVTRSLVNVRLENVRRHNPELWKGARKVEYVLNDGAKLTLHARQIDTSKWLHFSGEANAENVNRRLSDWDFQVSDYVYDDYVKSLDDMLAAEVSSIAE